MGLIFHLLLRAGKILGCKFSSNGCSQCIHIKSVLSDSGTLPQILNDLSLLVWCDLAVAVERGQHILVPEVLAPSLECFRRWAKRFPQLDKRVTKAVGIEIG